MKQSKYEDREDEGAMGALMAFTVNLGINIHIPLFFIKLHARSSLGLWVPVLTGGPKGL